MKEIIHPRRLGNNYLRQWFPKHSPQNRVTWNFLIFKNNALIASEKNDTHLLKKVYRKIPGRN